MKAYLAIKYFEDARNRGRIDRLTEVLRRYDVDLVCVARDHEEWGKNSFPIEKLMELSFGEINSSDFILVDLTTKGVGIGIEAGYAYANHTPIVTIAEKGSDISNTLKGISAHTYIYADYDKLETFLADAIGSFKL